MRTDRFLRSSLVVLATVGLVVGLSACTRSSYNVETRAVASFARGVDHLLVSDQSVGCSEGSTTDVEWTGVAGPPAQRWRGLCWIKGTSHYYAVDTEYYKNWPAHGGGFNGDASVFVRRGSPMPPPPEGGTCVYRFKQGATVADWRFVNSYGIHLTGSC